MRQPPSAGKPISAHSKASGRVAAILAAMIAPAALAEAQSTTLAEWTYVYAYSRNVEHDKLYRDNDTIYYVQSGNGLTLTHPFTVASIRRVTLWETNDELDVQVWAPRNVSVLVLHFNKSQRDFAQQLADRIERLY